MRSEISTPGSFGTPAGQSQSGPGYTPGLRDKLNINPEERMAVGDTPQQVNHYQKQVILSINFFLSFI